jgi:AcrR family transcriptional regulator
MFKTRRTEHEATERGDGTRDRILDAAPALFRKRGLDRTTMRDIAGKARASLGSAYYYFPSKEALVHGFYERVQERHRRRLEEVAPAAGAELGERIGAALAAKLDAVRDERALLGALFRYVGEPGHPLSPLSAATGGAREDAIATFASTLEGVELPVELRPLAARALWAAHLLLLLYFVHDDSPGQARSETLARRGGDLLAGAVRLLALPGAAALVAPAVDALVQAGLLPSPIANASKKEEER